MSETPSLEDLAHALQEKCDQYRSAEDAQAKDALLVLIREGRCSMQTLIVRDRDIDVENLSTDVEAALQDSRNIVDADDNKKKHASIASQKRGSFNRPTKKGERY